LFFSIFPFTPAAEYILPCIAFPEGAKENKSVSCIPVPFEAGKRACQKVKGNFPEIYVIGDSIKVRRIINGTFEGPPWPG